MFAYFELKIISYMYNQKELFKSRKSLDPGKRMVSSCRERSGKVTLKALPRTFVFCFLRSWCVNYYLNILAVKYNTMRFPSCCLMLLGKLVRGGMHLDTT